MENAGINVSGAVIDVLKERQIVDEDSARVVILCGGGNNGGDGYVIGRQLLCGGLWPVLYALKDPAALKGDAAVNHRACSHLGLEIHRVVTPAQVARHRGGWQKAHVLVDAMLGTGYVVGQTLREPFASAMEAVNGLQGPRVVSVDVPSGLDCDTGRSAKDSSGKDLAVRADRTVTFVAPKLGFERPGALAFLGQVVTADIGVPPGVAGRAEGGPPSPS